MNTTGTKTKAGSSGPAILAQGLSKRFGQVKAVTGLDLSIEAGEIVAFLGPNGAGKTTTVDMMLGLSDASSGTVEVLGGPPRKAAGAGRIAAVLQTGGLLRDLSVRETVTAIASMFKASDRVPDVLARADLNGIAKRRVGKCSGGEQQRLKFALALLPDPDVLILDEPTAGMDVNARRHFWEVMQADAEAGRTVVFATHYLEEAEQYAARTVVMNHGRLIADAPTRKLRSSLGGRTITALIPGTALDRLRGAPGVSQLHVPAAETLAGESLRIELRAEDSDAVARLLLNELGGSDLRIAEPSLEAAFTELTTGSKAAREPSDGSDESTRSAS
ncbi:ABC transporter ATP-binding protein [Galactobacter sp.]|uniref:ABC transporter ATP-binding protein n=1 Tax=Galactobacter sp. TaxID=2676125 RepID=UPI0025BBFC58|nr:ABC transporter ATP-binding protein [Galactobacter sp.]